MEWYCTYVFYCTEHIFLADGEKAEIRCERRDA